MTHPTQIFLSNPQALRVEYRLDDQRLELWWSPRAGRSTDCFDRTYSNRDAHLDVFASIHLPGCGLDGFLGCDYDPYHCVLRFATQTLHLALRPDAAAVLVWGEQPLVVDLKTDRHDPPVEAGAGVFAVRHDDPQRSFIFAAAIAPGSGQLRTSPRKPAAHPLYARAELAAGQLLCLGVGEADEAVAAMVRSLADQPWSAHASATATQLAPVLAMGRVTSSAHPRLAALRDTVVRCLHSMIDASGAYRASLKPIYYLIWVRDGGFSYPYQAAAGWPHKLPEFCRLLLDNPTDVDEPGLPRGRMFGQLIHRQLGKLEEDGLFYVVWSLHTLWTQTGDLSFMQPRDWQLLDEALAWVEQMTWDAERGLYGEHFGDETPTYGHRDHGWDHAIGKPIGYRDVMRNEGQPVVRNYDVYFNLLMHSCYAMLAAMRQRPGLLAKADAVWPALSRLLAQRHQGIPIAAGQILQDGRWAVSPHWGQAHSCCVWGLTLPSHAPLADWDAVRAATLDAIIAKPEMHFTNGVCSAIAAVDPWIYPEDRALGILTRIADETERPGRYLPMGGAMPEKLGAPEGNPYHDIRPQGFAMGSWLFAFASLGLRRLPYGLALRPTAAFDRIEQYPWHDRTLDLRWGPRGRDLALAIDGNVVSGTLQVPQQSLAAAGPHVIALVEAPATCLWLRSHVQLDEVDEQGAERTYRFTAHGLAEITCSRQPVGARLCDAAGGTIPCSWTAHDGLATCRFTHFGSASLRFAIA
ncbi:MAG TPA: hypothetical protein DCS97_07580 [Planctomycetes bacterium]|nr:hypothetical protein [Planctomycetota bacterium]